MSLRYVLLGLLAIEPATGYEIAQRFDRTLAHAWHASHSQIYPELHRLEESGLAEVVSEGARNSRTWGATAAGHEALRVWLTRTPPNRSVRDENAVRLFLISLLAPDERRAVLERELAYVEEEGRQLRAIAEELEATGGRGVFRPVVDLGLRINPVTQQWLHDEIALTREPPGTG